MIHGKLLPYWFFFEWKWPFIRVMPDPPGPGHQNRTMTLWQWIVLKVRGRVDVTPKYKFKMTPIWPTTDEVSEFRKKLQEHRTKEEYDWMWGPNGKKLDERL